MTMGRILLVEDSASAAQFVIDTLAPQAYEIVHAADGMAAWDLLGADAAPFDALILDREMPRMNGIELLRKLKGAELLRHVPVIMATRLGDATSIREGLDAGAYYYLAKPFAPEVLRTILRSALDQYREYRDLAESVRLAEQPIRMLDSGVYRFRTLDDGRALAKALARACPAPERAVLGLMELLINAVEHGNLGIGYDEKAALIRADALLDEIDRRLASAEGRSKYVTVYFERTQDALHIGIQDQGKGFDWRKYLEIDPSRAFDTHGRGIAMARMLSLDGLEYLGNGSMVRATFRLAEAV